MLSKPSTDIWGRWNVQNWWWMKCMKFATKLASQAQIIALYRCTNSHMIWLFVLSVYWKVWIWIPRCLSCKIISVVSHKIGLHVLLLRYDWEYFQFCFLVLGIHEISHAISHKLRLQALYWLEAVSKAILAKIS